MVARTTSNRIRRAVQLLSAVGIGVFAAAGGAHVLNVAGAPVGLDLAARAESSTKGARDFADIVEKVKPAVVGVRTRIERRSGSEESLPREAPSNRFFRQFGAPKDRSDAPRRPRFGTSQGSGFFISPDGYVVTTNHVIDGTGTIEITTEDGKTYPAKVIGTDPKTDLALLKVEGGDFPFVRLASNAPRIGEWVITVGHPFGLGGTVTAGIVSARARDIKMGSYNDFIQIDAPVNQGNSGGPTFDLNGNVIGVNSAIFSPTGGSVGIGFAIPAEIVEPVVTRLKQSGAVIRGWIGVQIQALTPQIAEGFGLKEAKGALVVEPQPDSPAQKAGVASGDVIASVNGEPVKDERDLMKRIGDLAPGTSVELGVLRGGEARTIRVTLGEMPGARNDTASRTKAPEAPTPRADTASLGFELVAGDKLGQDQGVIVTNLDPNGLAAELGFEASDVMIDVAGRPTKTPADVQKALHDARAEGRQVAIVRVRSGETSRFVAIPLG